MRSPSGSTLLASIAVCTLSLSRPPGALGAELHLPSPLPLAALLDAVRQRAPSLIERRRGAEAAALRPRALGRPSDPTLSLEWWQQPVDFQTVPLMVTARQTIPWPRTLRLQREAGEREARVASDEVDVELVRVEAEARRAWFDLALAEEALAVNQRMEALMRHLVDVAQAQYRVGRAAQAEVLRAQSELLMVQGERFDLERDKGEAAARLNGLLDRPASAPLGPAAAPPPPVPLPSRGALATLLAERRPDVRLARDRIAAAESRRALAEREARPELSAWAGYTVNLRGTDMFSVGIASTLPLFSRGRSGALVDAERAGIDAARAALAEALRRADVEVETALVRIEAAARHVKLHAEQLVPLADSALQSAEASYIAGRVGLSTVLDAARAVREHHLDHQRFLADHHKRLADLEEAVGAPLAGLSAGEGGRP